MMGVLFDELKSRWKIVPSLSPTRALLPSTSIALTRFPKLKLVSTYKV
jgi:hypothetical protein